jgi:hypothetical protein
MKTKLLLLLILSGSLILGSCTKYPAASDRVMEDLVVVTQYDTKVDFNNYQTFGITSSITKISDNDTSVIIDSEALAILNQIAENMKSRGFIEAPTGTKPDFGIQVLYFENTQVYVYYYDWWGYYPSWYYYYPYSPVYYSSYTTGLLDVQMIDLKFPNTTNNTLVMRWNAYIRGIMDGTHSQSEILGAVDQAFAQTPQLTTTAN